MILGPNVPPFDEFPEFDADWNEDQWAELLAWLIDSGLVTTQEVAALALGALNPPQVGTSIATKKSFQKNYPPRKTMQAVYEWLNSQRGRCKDCQTRLDLQADHIVPIQEIGEEADSLENMTLRCRRCNVVRRESHKLGGLTFLTTQAALMWLLFAKRPRRYSEYEQLCRDYGLTMANIRFHEAWAIAHWLNREGLYEVDD